MTRNLCMVPCGKDLFFPIFNVICWSPGDCDPTNLDGCRLCAIGFIDPIKTTGTLQCSVDEKEIADIEDHREASAFFDYTVPESNIFNHLPPLTRKGVADGYYVCLKPLPPGPHTIHFKAGTPDFATEVTYNLTVLPCDFLRGDADVDGAVNITDVIALLGYMYFSDPVDLSCKDAADADNSGDLNVTDAIASLGWQFLGDPHELPSPGVSVCGPDPADPPDDFSSCDYSSCP